MSWNYRKYKLIFNFPKTNQHMNGKRMVNDKFVYKDIIKHDIFSARETSPEISDDLSPPIDFCAWAKLSWH